MRALRGLAALVAVVGCGCQQGLQLNLVIYNACDQEGALGSADHIELGIASEAEGTSENVIWDAEDGAGEMPNVPAFTDAMVSVLGRESSGSGDPGAPVVATTVGQVDLSGAGGNPLVELNVVVGRVGQFMNTTDTADEQLACSSLEGPRRDHAAVRLNDGRVLIAGGYRTLGAGSLEWWSFLEIFDPRTGTYSEGDDLKGARRGMSATLLDDGRVLLAGGEGPIDGVVQASKSTQLFDPADSTLGTPVPMSIERAYHTATLMADGRVLLAGGRNDSGVLDTFEVFDPATGETTQGASTLLVARAHHSAVRVAQGVVALIGGQSASGPVAKVELVNVDTGAVIDGPDLLVARSHAVATMVPGAPGYVAVLGGFATALGAPEEGQGLGSIEFLQINTSAAEPQAYLSPCNPTLQEARGAAMWGEINDGILLMGGVGSSGDLVGSAEIFRVDSIQDIATCFQTGSLINPTLLTLDNLGQPRAGATVNSLLGGDLLITGGIGYDAGEITELGQGEIYIQYR